MCNGLQCSVAENVKIIELLEKNQNKIKSMIGRVGNDCEDKYYNTSENLDDEEIVDSEKLKRKVEVLCKKKEEFCKIKG